MKTYFSCLLVVSMLVNSSSLQAAAPAVKRGVSAATAAKLKQAAEANAAQSLKARADSLQKAAQQTADQLKSERTAFDAALKKQPEFAQFKKEFDALIALSKDPNTSNTKAKRDDLRTRLKAFSTKYDPLQLKAYQEAKVDDNKVKAAITTAYTPALGQQITVAKRGLAWSVTPILPPSVLVPPPTVSVPPYDTSVTITDTTAVAFPIALADKADGTFFTRGKAYVAGGGTVVAGVGNNFTIPPGTHQVKVTATIQDEFEVMAWAIAGVGWGGSGLMLGVTTGNNVQLQPQVLPTAHVVAPIMWFSYDYGSGEYTLTKTYSLSGGEVLVLAEGYIQVGGAAGSEGYAWQSGTVKQLSVEILSSSAQ